ncbi:hypothetical protein C5S29_03085 [ANME-1 cluster archaeon GoMg3.2]|nr:hypothetical protein [ANME-1 cluster archaeon GoMg3.2]
MLFEFFIAIQKQIERIEEHERVKAIEGER